MRLAFVVQRYGLDLSGGAELECRLTGERLKTYFDVEVLTTKAFDYITWRNHYPDDEEIINGILVRRFPVVRLRHPGRFGRLQDYLLSHEHTEEEELRWMDEMGPCVPELIRYIKLNEKNYDYFIFFSYRYYPSFWGTKTVPHKSILVPTAEQDPIIRLPIFRDLFRLPRAIVYNSPEEKEMINAISGNKNIPSVVGAVGIEISASASSGAFRQKYRLEGPYVLYLGRVDENKGCAELFSYFLQFKKETGSNLKLVLAGPTVMRIPPHPDILFLGYVGEEDKLAALEGAELLVMPSLYESLSIVTLEAWALAKPVLANARCDVLKGQCLRSQGGLFYENYPEFREALSLLLKSARFRQTLGENGKKYCQANYAWDIIEKKYISLLETLENSKGS